MNELQKIKLHKLTKEVEKKKQHTLVSLCKETKLSKSFHPVLWIILLFSASNFRVVVATPPITRTNLIHIAVMNIWELIEVTEVGLVCIWFSGKKTDQYTFLIMSSHTSKESEELDMSSSTNLGDRDVSDASPSETLYYRGQSRRYSKKSRAESSQRSDRPQVMLMFLNFCPSNPAFYVID